MTDRLDPVKALEAHLEDRPVTAMEAMAAIVKCDGDLMHAAATLGVKQANLITAIVQDQANADLLASYFRTFTMLKAFAAVGRMHDAVMDQVDSLNPRDLARTYVNALDTFSKFVEKDGSPAPVGNPLDLIVRALPAEVQAAFKSLIEPDNVTNLADYDTARESESA